MFPIKDSILRQCKPIATWSLIAINIFVFIITLQLPHRMLEAVFFIFGVIPLRMHVLPIMSQEGIFNLMTFFSCMFLHGGWFHIITNMWMLWIFGDNVEDQMGAPRFCIFYLITGVFASVVHVIFSPFSQIPVVGASGAISGVLAAYLGMFPRAVVTLLIPIFFFPFLVDVPAVFFLVFWFLEQFLSGTIASLGSDAGSGVAWWAHVGGFVSGLVLYRLFLIGRPPRPCWQPDRAYKFRAYKIEKSFKK